jgi:hypothetical protein
VARQHIELDQRIAEMRRARQELRTLLEHASNLPDGDACYCQLIEHPTADHEMHGSP